MTIGFVVTLDPCEMESCIVRGDLIPDPFNCTNYYICDEHLLPSQYPNSCPMGNLFDVSSSNCQPSNVATCTPPCEPCTFDCDNSGLGKASHRDDCSKYYQCDSADPTVPVSCDPSTPYFDGYKCQTDASKCCNCKPICKVLDVINFSYLPDYSNCTCYYQCGTDDSNSFPSHHGCCSVGNFDPSTTLCSEDAPCDQLCRTKDCNEEFICQDYGYFPVCHMNCDPRFFDCMEFGAVGKPAKMYWCNQGLVFNPETEHCVSPDQCPCPCVV